MRDLRLTDKPLCRDHNKIQIGAFADVRKKDKKKKKQSEVYLIYLFK